VLRAVKRLRKDESVVQCGVTIGARDGTSDPDNSCPATKPELTSIFKVKSSRNFKIREEWAMRALILALSVLGILAIADAAKASPSTTIRDDLSASVDPATFTDQATQETEDQIGLDKGGRRDVQRRLTGLGFHTRANGKFDKSTRAVITRWQEARGYPKTGFLNTLQHKALQTEFASAAQAGSSSSDKSDDGHPARRGGGAHRHRGVGGPVGLIGGVVGGLFGR
jgi:hypothetical protein